MKVSGPPKRGAGVKVPAVVSPAGLRCTHPNALRSHTMSTTMTLRLEDDVKERLDKLAEATQRSKSFLAAEAIREFVENNEWQLRDIKAAIKEANPGDFAGDDEVVALTKKWKVNAR
jgi:predicted transcriptional regulator